jgi:hypothetical protein
MDKINIIRVIKILLLLFVSVALQSCNYNDNKNLGSSFVYYADHKMISSSTGECGGIPSSVLEYNHDKSFIIATQKPIENDPNALLYDSEYTYREGYNTVYYWIILKDNKKVIGPMSKSEFIEAREKYNVPENLMLNK